MKVNTQSPGPSTGVEKVDVWEDQIKKTNFQRKLEVQAEKTNTDLSIAQIAEELRNPQLAAMMHYFLTGIAGEATVNGVPESDPQKEKERVEANLNKGKAFFFLTRIGFARNSADLMMRSSD